MSRCTAQRPRHIDVVIRLTEATDSYWAKCLAIQGVRGNALSSKADTIGAACEAAIVSSMARVVGFESPLPEDPRQLAFPFAG